VSSAGGDLVTIDHAPLAYDYSGITPDVAGEMRRVAERIHGVHQKARASMLAIGKDLAGIKAKLEHGQFSKWIAAEFDMTIRTAQNYMSAAAFVGDKSERVSHLPMTMIRALAASPEPVRQEYQKRIGAGERIQPAEVKDRLQEVKWARREVDHDASRQKRKPRRERRRPINNPDRDKAAALELKRIEAARQERLARSAKIVGSLVDKLGRDALALIAAALREADKHSELRDLMEALEREVIGRDPRMTVGGEWRSLSRCNTASPSALWPSWRRSSAVFPADVREPEPRPNRQETIGGMVPAIVSDGEH
jgi:hypothetical protein